MRGVNRFVYLTRQSNGYRFANMKYGERLKMAREHAGLTQQQLADACNIRQPSVQHLEDVRNNSSGSIHTVMFARVCGVSADWLADNTGEMLPHEYRTTDPKIIAVARCMEPMPEYGKDAAVKDVAEVAQLIAQAKANGTHG